MITISDKEIVLRSDRSTDQLACDDLRRLGVDHLSLIAAFRHRVGRHSSLRLMLLEMKVEHLFL